MIHGFFTGFNSAKSSFQSAVSSLKPHLGDMNYVGIHWPSDVLWFGTAVETANQMGPYVTHVMGQIMSWYGNGERKIHLISHSLGGRVLLKTLQENSTRFVNWGHCFAMASGVHCVSYQDKFIGTNLVPRHTMVYYSTEDGVLKYLYALYYMLFPDGFATTPEYAEWQKKTAEEQIAYLRQLEKKADKSRLGEFDQFAYEQIKRSEKDAMGLVGAVLDGPMKIVKVTNVNVTNIVSGHTYWQNPQVMKLISDKIKE